ATARPVPPPPDAPSPPTAFGIVDVPLVEAGARLESAIEHAGLETQSAAPLREELKTERPAEQLMLSAVDAEEIIPPDDGRAVHGGDREIDARGEREAERESPAREPVDQMPV